MRQYCPNRGIIAKRVWAMLIAGAVACAAGTAHAQAVPDYLEYRRASAEAFEQQGQPSVRVGAAKISGAVLEADVTVQPWAADNMLSFVIAAPAGDVTSASLVVEELFEDGAAGRAPVLSEDMTTTGLDFYPEQAVTARHLGWIRGSRLLKVQMPAIVAGSFGRRLKAGKLRLAYKDAAALEADKHSVLSEPFNRLLSQLVANPGDLAKFAVTLDNAPAAAESAPVPLGTHNDAVARFTTQGEGFRKFSGADLAAAGIDLAATSVTSVTVWSNGEQVAVHASAAWNDPYQMLKPEDEFLVYARDSDSTYTATRTYWIRLAQQPPDPHRHLMQLSFHSPGAASVEPAYFTATHLVEKDVPPVLTQNDQFLTILGYRWVWFTWTPSGNGTSVPNPRNFQTSGSMTFDLQGLAQRPDTAVELDLSFYAHQWPKATKPVPMKVSINGNDLGRIEITNPQGLDHTVKAPLSAVRSTSNTLVLTPETSGTSNLPELSFDKLTVRYPRTYSMTSTSLEFYPPSPDGGPVDLDLSAMGTSSILVADVSGEIPEIIGTMGGPIKGRVPVRTKGPADRRYTAVVRNVIPPVKLEAVRAGMDLRATSNTADLLVIAWPEFIGDLAPWVERKRAKGHAVQVVSVQDVYDQFGYGHLSPHALREFIRYAAIHWQGSEKGPAAGTVLLVGDSTSAYRNEFRNDVINYVPTMRLTDGADPFASDQWFVSIFGNDPLADAIIGRFSVNSRADFRNLIGKQLDYETKSAEGAWKNTLGFVADHSEFAESVDRVMRRAVPPRYFMDSIRMDDLPWIDNYYFPKEIADAREAKVSPAATRRIRDLFNNGAAVVTYFGHGSPNIWSNERMWFGGDSPNSDNLLLANHDRLPIVINMTCNSGAIDYPQPRWNICISEDFMRVENGGSVACFVPSGPGLTVQHERLMMEVGYSLFDASSEPLGESMQLALWRYLAAGNPEELAKMYIFLGDPLLEPHIARPMQWDSPGERKPSPEWPGTIALPADVAGRSGGGAYQFTAYGKTVEPGKLGTFTSSTVALPVVSRSAEDAQALALAVRVNESSATESTVAPTANLGAVKLVQWRRVDKATATDSTATLELRLRNDAPVPVSRLQLQASVPDGSTAATSENFNLAPFEERYVSLEVPAIEGLNQLAVSLSDGKVQRKLEPDTPVAVAGLRKDDQREEVPPAVVDPRSIVVKYRQSGDAVTAAISAQVYITAAEPLSNLRIGVEGPDAVVVQESVVSVPPVSPGEGTRVSLSVTIPGNAPAADFKLRFDPSGFYPEFARFPAQVVPVGTSQFGDAQIVSVTPSTARPTDGETVFFDVVIKNSGKAPIDGIKVAGYRIGDGDEMHEMESKVAAPPSSIALLPGASETIRLRWDPFANAGKNRLRFVADSIYDMPDANADNNGHILEVNVRTKARIRFLDVGPLPLTPQDQAARQVRFAAQMVNEGETDVEGIRVMFHSDEPRTPDNLLGEMEVDSIRAGETKTVILNYTLKQGEEHKPFRLSCEALYKGSRQRVSVH